MSGNYDEKIYWEMINRQKEILNKKEQSNLKNSTIAVIGCGGIGGAAIEMLTRMGVSHIKIVDKDKFDITNINRQLMSSLDSVGREKTEVTKEKIHSINPLVNVETFNIELNKDNVRRILKDSKIIVDALDNLESRIITSRCALELDIPFVHGAIHGTMGQITTFTKKTPTYEETFKLPSYGKDLNPEVLNKLKKITRSVPPVIGPIPNIVGCIQSFEVIKMLIKRGTVITAPDILVFDLMKKNPFSIVKF
ncbi:MAG: HesA/MoeB/ThiF family protein [Methanobacterium sp.]|nr:HesA/MoeB/ThiF family protein [Methanobacterium sp.]